MNVTDIDEKNVLFFNPLISLFCNVHEVSGDIFLPKQQTATRLHPEVCRSDR